MVGSGAAMTVCQGSFAASAATCLLRQSADMEVVISAKPNFAAKVPKVAAVRTEKNSTQSIVHAYSASTKGAEKVSAATASYNARLSTVIAGPSRVSRSRATS